MFKNYFKTAWRNIRRHKAYSSINILGLAIGIAGCMLILQYVSFELSYEDFAVGSAELTADDMKKLDAKDARDCTLKCGKNGSFVLYDPGTKTVYQLNNQEKPVRYAGERVKISGQYDDWSQTIEIESIEPAP